MRCPIRTQHSPECIVFLLGKMLLLHGIYCKFAVNYKPRDAAGVNDLCWNERRFLRSRIAQFVRNGAVISHFGPARNTWTSKMRYCQWFCNSRGMVELNDFFGAITSLSVLRVYICIYLNGIKLVLNCFIVGHTNHNKAERRRKRKSSPWSWCLEYIYAKTVSTFVDVNYVNSLCVLWFMQNSKMLTICLPLTRNYLCVLNTWNGCERIEMK